jgi:heat-inducible transcriptional repressor
MAPEKAELPEQLSSRQRDIFRVLVQEYVDSAMPVGSQTLLQVGRLGVSSATVRNELAALEELGFVAQPHTSAGRIPTVKGYRYFVEQLMETKELSLPEQRTIRHQFHQIRLDLEQWLRLTAAVLAHTAQFVALVTPPHATLSRFKHMELIAVNNNMGLLILVLQDGTIRQELIGISSELDQNALSQTSNKINALLGNRTAAEVAESTSPELATLQEWETQILQRVLFVMQQMDRQSVSEVYRDGLVNVLAQPEFLDPEKLRQIVAVLEQRNLLEAILERILNANGVQIIIGGEGLGEAIEDVSLVLSPYGIRGEASGVLGVMGPTRMPYARVISTVRYVAQILDDLMQEVHGL